MKLFRIAIIIITFTLSLSGAIKHSQAEVQNIISNVQNTLKTINSEQQTDSKDEITKIKYYITHSKSLLKLKKIDQAYYEINIANTLFEIIKVRSEYKKENSILSGLKDKLNKEVE